VAVRALRDYLELPIQTLKVGALGTHNALGLAKALGASFLLASTSEVYGDPLVHSQREDYWGNVNPVGPRGVYDEAKRFAEAVAMAYHWYHGLDTRIVRIFNTFGPRMRLNDGRAIPAFMTQALIDAPVTVFGDGSQTRSFQYIDDLLEGIWRLMHAPVHDPVNLGNPQEMTLLDLAKRVIRLAGSRSEIIFRGLPQDDPKVRQPDIGRAHQVLGWEPASIPRRASAGYRADALQEHFREGEQVGVRMRYAIEETPRGRGGGFKLGFGMVPASQTLVIGTNGDILCGQPLAPVVEFHRRHGALATVLLTQLRSPYGIATLRDDVRGKVLHVTAGHTFSLQYHERKEETIHLFSGEAVMVYHDDAGRPGTAGDTFHIPPHSVSVASHRRVPGVRERRPSPSCSRNCRPRP
jgi:nucleoside-diphosphate-sugar epimerase